MVLHGDHPDLPRGGRVTDVEAVSGPDVGHPDVLEDTGTVVMDVDAIVAITPLADVAMPAKGEEAILHDGGRITQPFDLDNASVPAAVEADARDVVAPTPGDLEHGGGNPVIVKARGIIL